MEKPRIIIADTDSEYIIPLQYKFVEEYFEQVDIEVITDREYFSKLFSVPQHVDVLVIAESMYDLSIRKHNISDVFLMTEQYEAGQTTDLNITRIYKYTSIKEIFNEIIGESTAMLAAMSGTKREPQIITFCSAAGGVGKTIVAMGVSASLTRNHKRVLYIEAAHLQTAQYMLENTTPISAPEIYANLARYSSHIYSDIKHIVRKEGFSYIPPFKAALMALGLEYGIFQNIAQSVKHSGEFDYVVVDTDVSFDEDKAKLMSISDKVIVVTNQSLHSVYATECLVENIGGINADKFIFVCNQFNREKENALISTEKDIRFSVSEYIEKYKTEEELKIEMLSQDASMQRIAYLIC